MLSKSKLLYVLVVVGLICLAQSAWGKGSGGGPQKLDNVLSYKSDLI
jgi:hypothetical protein